MDVLLYSINALLPIVLPIALGYLIRRLKMLSAETLREMNGMIFKTLLPLLIFMNIYGTETIVRLPVRELAFALTTILLIFAVAWLGVALLVKRRELKGMIIQALFRSNFVLYGVPLSSMLLGDKTSGITEILIAFVIPLYNFLAVFILSYYGGKSFSLKEVAGRILRNPLIIACVLAILVKQLGLVIPEPLLPALSTLAKTATPLALLVLGGQFFFSSGRKYLRYLVPTVTLRIFFIPLLVLFVAVKIGFPAESLIAFLALFASPVAVSSYTMAQQMCEDAELSAQILVYTSVFSAFSLLFFISIGRFLALI